MQCSEGSQQRKLIHPRTSLPGSRESRNSIGETQDMSPPTIEFAIPLPISKSYKKSEIENLKEVAIQIVDSRKFSTKEKLVLNRLDNIIDVINPATGKVKIDDELPTLWEIQLLKNRFDMVEEKPESIRAEFAQTRFT